jgi:hypothetical protein
MPYLVAIVRSDSDQLNRAARRCIEGLQVLVQIRSTGHVRIFSDKHRNLSPVAAQLRLRLRRRAGRTDQVPMSYLLSPGTLEDIPEIFNWTDGGAVFNSTNTAPNTRPIIRRGGLTEHEVVSAITKGLESIAHREMVNQSISQKSRRVHART